MIIFTILMLKMLLVSDAQRGEFHEEGNGETLVFSSNGIAPKELGSFRFYGSDENLIQISRHGVVGIGDSPNDCPPSDSDALTFSNRYVAPFWIPSTDGSVTFLLKTKEELSNGGDDLSRLVSEANKAYINDNTHEPLSIDIISRVAFITWNRMSHKDNVPRTQLKKTLSLSPDFSVDINLDNKIQNSGFFIRNEVSSFMQMNRNSFQLVFVILNNGNTFAFFIYRLLDYELVYNLQEARIDAPCRSKALIGIGTNNDFNTYVMSIVHFRSSRTTAAVFSNIDDNQELGRYVFKLWVPRASQAKPVTRNCNGNMPDEKTCLLIEVNVRLSNEFCLWRDPGLYRHPLLCDYFLVCSVLNERADVKQCTSGLNFNPVIGTCDFKENWECNPLGNLIVKDRDFTTPTPQKVIHGNKCLLRGWSNIPDPSSCDHYLACTNTRTILLKCPAGLYFRVSGIEDGQCDYRRNVRCVNGTRFDKEKNSTKV